MRECSQALRQLAPRGRWTIVANLEDVEELVAYLAPASELAASPVALCGGAVLLVDEVDIVAPPKTSRSEVRMLWRRSRHLGLSIVATTQRPENCNREVTSQSPQVVCLQLVEPAAYDYMSQIMRVGLTPLQQWVRHHPHGGLWVETRTGEQRWLSEAGHWLRPAVPLPGVAHPPGGSSPASAPAGLVGARVAVPVHPLAVSSGTPVG